MPAYIFDILPNRHSFKAWILYIEFSCCTIKTITKKFADLSIFLSGFLKFYQNNKYWKQIFCNSEHLFTFLWACELPNKFWAWSVQPLWRLLDTNKQTNTQAKYIFIEYTSFRRKVILSLTWKRIFHQVKEIDCLPQTLIF